MLSPRIVVAMAVYNEAAYLDETIPAVLAQTMPYFYFVILDNGSTDRSFDILEKYAKQDERIRLFPSFENLAPASVANWCWPLALRTVPSCRWFLPAGADDVMAPDYLEAVLAAADANPTANLIQSPVTYIGHPERGTHRWPDYNADTIHAEPQISGWRAFTRELWEANGPENEAIRIGADWEWAVRASAKGLLRPVQLERPYIALRVRTNRTSQSQEVDWPALHRHLCDVAGKPVPDWAARRRRAS
jgi:glycosyltransferase involved in cell wall biosynthesis